MAVLLSSLAACTTTGSALAWPEPILGVDKMTIRDNIRVKTSYTYKTNAADRDYTVVLRLLVDAEGKVAQQQIEQASGNAPLDEAAMHAARTTRFAPYLVDGQPRPVTVLMPMHFKLKPPA